MIMNKVIHIAFNQKDIENTIKKLENLNKELKNFDDKLIKEIAYDGLTKLDTLYAITPYQPNVSAINTSVNKTTLGYSIVATGKDVIYEEFGTGDIGESNPHPEKAEYPLNDYNSGKTIRDANEYSAEHGITSGKYWTYKKDGTIYYTQGIPAGKQFFDTRNYIQKEGIKKAKDKLVGDMLSKL